MNGDASSNGTGNSGQRSHAVKTFAEIGYIKQRAIDESKAGTKHSLSSLLDAADAALKRTRFEIDHARNDLAYYQWFLSQHLLKVVESHPHFSAQNELYQTTSKSLKVCQNLLPLPEEAMRSTSTIRSSVISTNGSQVSSSSQNAQTSNVPTSRYNASSTSNGTQRISIESARPNGSSQQNPKSTNAVEDPLVSRFAKLRLAHAASPPANGTSSPDKRTSLNGPRPLPKTSSLPPPPPLAPPPLSYSGAGLSHTAAPNRDISVSSSTRPAFKELSVRTEIEPDELYDYIKKYKVLIIDVRPRAEFDDGHIFSSSVVCIEPLSLRQSLDITGLEDSLLYSPASEISLLKQIADFDLVVYHDESTHSTDFLRSSSSESAPNPLRILYDALTSFNYDKSLMRPPALLMGGLAAWVDLVSPQALQQSKTLNVPANSLLRKPAKRSLHRASIVSGNSSREIRSRRLASYTPLNPDEVKKWQDKANNENVSEPPVQPVPVGEEEPEQETQINYTYEDFFRKYPHPSDIQESMTTPKYVAPPPPRPPSAQEDSYFSASKRPELPSMPSRPAPVAPRRTYSGVSETNSSLSQRPRESIRQPLYTGKSMSRRLKLPRTGLKNFGVTCYMNATLQCLSATVDLTQLFFDERYKYIQQKNWKGSNGIMPDYYANLVRALWNDKNTSVVPSSFRQFCTRLNPEWGLDRQQDAKEFLEFLVDCLHEDLNQNWNRTPLQPLTRNEEIIRERMPIATASKYEWQRFDHRDRSVVSALFAGQHASRLRCRTCNNTSTTYEAFYSISVEIPSSGNKVDIRDCLKSYTKEEMLSGDEEWKCPYCNTTREAYKKITITRAPQILVVHFKRFSASKSESARKIHTPVEFPLHGLDIQPFMADTRLKPDSSSRPSSSDGYPDPAITPPFLYDAYGVMRHIGSTGNGGHYISLIKDAAQNTWRKFDDTTVTDIDPAKLRPDQRLQNEQAYIVFYERARGI